MAENMRDNTEMEDALVNKGKEVGADLGKKGVKKAGELAAKGAKAVGKAATEGIKFLATKGPVGWIIIAVLIGLPVIVAIVGVLIMLNPFQKLGEVWKNIKEGVYGQFASVFNIDQFDEPRLNAWRESEDPYDTFKLYSALDKEFNAQYRNGTKWDQAKTADGDETLDYQEVADSFDKEALTDIKDLVEFEGNINMSSDDMIKILKFVNDENEQMFVYRDLFYGNQVWSIGEKDNGHYDEITHQWVDPTEWWYEWEKSEDADGNVKDTRNDNKYGLVTEENFRGEEYGGEKIYQVRWPELMSFAYFYGTEKYAEEGNAWGTSDDSAYEHAQIVTGADGREHLINSTENYYLSAKDRKDCEDMFGWHFEYYYQATKAPYFNKPSNEKYITSYEGNHKPIAYRLDRFDRQPYHDDIYDLSEPKPHERVNKDWGLGKYHNDPGYEPLTTEYVPETAPYQAYNLIETHVYFYIPTSEVEGYVPDPEYYEPPEGDFCIGKWKIVDPAPFFDRMRELCHWYDDIDTEYNREHLNYNAVDELVERYLFYIEFLEEVAGMDDGRADYYRHLAELYKNEEVEVFYYGMKADEETMSAYTDKIIELYPGKSISFNYDEAREFGEYYEVSWDDVKDQARAGTIPFPCYGVATLQGGTSIGDNQSGNFKVEANYVGDFYVSETSRKGPYHVDGWAHLQEGADESLRGSHAYTREQIAGALSRVASKGNSYTFPSGIHAGERYTFDWSACVDDLYEYNQSTGNDVIGLLAIIYTEYTPRVGFPTWNWFNLTTSGGHEWHREASDSYNWWNPREEFSGSYIAMGYSSLEGCCMVECCKSIVSRYWNVGQDTYFKMTWNEYGWDPSSGEEYLPQNWDEALECEQHMESVNHCYCPWWDDNYVTHNYDSYYLWCNVCARNRSALMGLTGSTGSVLGDRVPMDFSNLPTDLNALIGMSFEEIFKYIVNDANANYSDYKKFSPEIQRRLEQAMAENVTTITVPVRQWVDSGNPTDMRTTTVYMKMKVNRVVAPLIQAAMEEAYNANDGTVIRSYDGAYNVRSMRGSSSTSAHAFGAAIDLNASSGNSTYSNGFGSYSYSNQSAHDSMAENHTKYEVFYEGGAYVEAFKHYGFVWGGDFNGTQDGMHFSFVGDYGEHAREKGQQNAANY